MPCSAPSLRAVLRVAVAAMALVVLAAPVEGQGASLVLAVDVERFSERASAWTSASLVRRAENAARAEELGRQAALAATESARVTPPAEAAPSRAVTTTAAPATTTVPAPTTTAPVVTTTVAVVTTTTAPVATTTVPVDGPTPEQWAALRHCESGGRYDAVSPTGAYRGAYQYSQATWDWVAGFADPSLVGVDPAAAAPADQDAQALALFDRQGASPWPHCGVHLS